MRRVSQKKNRTYCQGAKILNITWMSFQCLFDFHDRKYCSLNFPEDIRWKHEWPPFHSKWSFFLDEFSSDNYCLVDNYYLYIKYTLFHWFVLITWVINDRASLENNHKSFEYWSVLLTCNPNQLLSEDNIYLHHQFY